MLYIPIAIGISDLCVNLVFVFFVSLVVQKLYD